MILKEVLIPIGLVMPFTIILSGVGFAQAKKYIPYIPDPKKTALIIIDMQYGFLEPGALIECKYPGWNVLIPNHQRLIKFFRQNKIPIIWVAGEIKPESHGLIWTMFPTIFGPPTLYLAPGKHETEIVKEIAPLPGELVVWKNFYDAFCGTNLEIILRTLDIEYTAFTGVATTTCVSCSVRSAFHRQFRPFIITDATGALTKEMIEYELAKLSRCFGRGITSDELIAELETQLLEK